MSGVRANSRLDASMSNSTLYLVTREGETLDANKLEIPPEQANSSQWPKANKQLCSI